MAEDSAKNPKGRIKKYFGLSTLAINNRTSVIILSFIIVIMGVYSYQSMPKESFPEIVIPTVYVSTPYPGNSPVDMENLITRPIEKEIQGINGIDQISSTSVQDHSSIIVEFNPEIDKGKALQDVKDAVDKAKSDLPDDLDQDPSVNEINTSEIPIMAINLSGDYSLETLKEYAEVLEEDIEALTEVSSAEIKGALNREIQVNADIHKMESMEVSFRDIQDAISSENVTISGGNVKSGEFRRSLRVIGEFSDPAQINDVIVKNEDQNIVYVSDVAEVEDTYEDRESYARMNKLPVLTIDVVKRSGENLIEAANKINNIIDDAQATEFPPGIDISITNDQSDITKRQVSNLENSIISGVILVMLVLAFFLGSRNGVIVGLAIPMSMFLSFLVLNAMGVTLNLMVLFSLILALGLLVDNAIVVVENIYRLYQEGYSPMESAKQGVGEVAMPIITSTATTLAAFLPLAFWHGIVGEFMKYLPITLIIVLTSSLFVALVINPVFTSMFARLPEEESAKKKTPLIVAGSFIAIAIICYIGKYFAPANILMLIGLFIPANIYLLTPSTKWFQDVFLSKIENAYDKTMEFCLKKFPSLMVFFGTILLLIFSIGLLIVRAPKVIFFPINEPQYVNIFIEKPIGTDIEVTNTLTTKIENEIHNMMEPYDYMVESIIAKVGQGAGDPSSGPLNIGGGSTPHKASITVSFEAYEERKGVSTTMLMNRIREAMEKYPGVQIIVDKNQNGPPTGPPINIEISGKEYAELADISTRMMNTIQNSGIQGIEELQSDLESGKPEILVDVNRDKANRFGLSTSSIANELRTALFGSEVSQYKEGEDEYPIQLRLKEKYRNDVSALLNKRVTFKNQNTGKVNQVPISSVANVDYSSTYGSVNRLDLDRVVTISSNVIDGYNANEIVGQLKNLLSDFNMPDGYTFQFTGEQEEQKESSAFLMRALTIAVLTIFLIIVAQFNSLATPFIIMASVLFSTIGVFLGLFIFNMDFVVVMTGIGIISLAGVVVNNAIVLIDYTNLVRRRKRQEKGLTEDQKLSAIDLRDSIIEGGKTRLRPVLLTAITTVLGLIPLAIGMNINFSSLISEFDPEFFVGGDNADFWGPMAWTVIFGLVFSTFLTLVVVPVMYLLTDKLQLKFMGKK